MSSRRLVKLGYCEECRKEIFPVKKLCPFCGATLLAKQLPALGTVVSWTKVYVPPEGFGPDPYKIVLVRINETSASLLCPTAVPEVDIGDKIILEIRGEDWTIVEIE
ncbi:MAG: Zn-ribbon domain-containing OB-fold protein [Candidatus Heimdallarchaeota archaeon]